MNKSVRINNVTNGAEALIDLSIPYTVEVTIQGSADILFHRWNDDTVAAKATAAKNSKAKKTDDLESYVYRDEAGNMAIPGENVRQSIILSAKYRQDPRSPRKSAMDLYKAGIVALTDYASLGVREWDYEDRRRVTIQRAGITRVRPAMRKGWRATFQFLVNTPEYITPEDLREVIEQAGRLVGVGDFRPTFGRYGVVLFDILRD